MKALDYLYRMKQANEEMGCEAININEAIKELESLKLYVKSLEEYKRLVTSFLQIKKSSCGILTVNSNLCSHKHARRNNK